jgi:YVTN family beta-propeller protein
MNLRLNRPAVQPTRLLVVGGVASLIGVLGAVWMISGVLLLEPRLELLHDHTFMASNQNQPEIVLVGSRTGQSLRLVDPLAGNVSATIEVGMPVQNMVLSPDGATVWLFNSQPSQTDFATVNLANPTHTDKRRLRDDPTAAAFSSDGQRAYVVLGGANASPPTPSSVLFLDAVRATELAQVDVGEQTAGVQIQRRLGAIAVAPGSDGDVVYVAGRGSGTVWALDAASGTLLRQIEVGGGPLAVVADPEHQRVFVLTDTTNELVAIDASDQSITERLTLPGRPSAAALGRNGRLYVTGVDAGQLWPIDIANWQLDAPVPVGSEPTSAAVGLDGNHVYVALAGDASLVSIDPTTNTVTSKISIGGEPDAVLVARAADATGDNASSASATAGPAGRPTSIPTPKAKPVGARPPEHLPSGLVTETFIPANSPVAIAFANDGTLFYNELTTGKIRIVQNGSLLADPFYQFKVAGGPETGLLGLALDPNFDTNHYVYAFYTSIAGGKDAGGPNGPNEVVRLTDVANKGVDPTPMLELPSAPIHNGGALRFGPDGKLYVALGDNDQGSNAQDLSTPAGKILRVDPDGGMPQDNPFGSQPGRHPAVWAYGLRNVFGFDFDPISGGLFATENGPGDNDELDLIVGGANYGWPPTGYKYKPGIQDPIAVMNPPIGPSGSAFYTGQQIPEWTNDWFYCNYHQSQLRRVHLAPESRDRVVFEEVVKNGCSLAVATGPDGALYYTDARGIYRIHSDDAAGLIPLLAADGVPGQSPVSTPESVPTGMRPEDRDVGVTLNEWHVQASRAQLPSGQIRFLAEDTGETQHALRIVGEGVDLSTDAFGPGSSRDLQAVLAPGTYQLTCPIPGHEALGMSATITVVGP